jgi:diguanylate cyclase (GGDEF)-like protein
MPVPKLPPNEKDRLESLRALKLLETPSEERFNRITRIARKSFNTPIAVISLVDKDRLWFKSTQGLAETETSRAASFCGHAILQDETMVVTDALSDPRVCDSALVKGKPHFRIYMGHPIKSPKNEPIGTLCVLALDPRKVTQEEIHLIQDLAFLVERELKLEKLDDAHKELILELDEAKRKALIDPLSRLWNRNGISLVLEKRVAFSKTSKKPFAIALVDLDHFKSVNDEYGHPVGDLVLAEAAQRLRKGAREFDAVGRFGGEEFIIVMPEVGEELGKKVCERILESLRKNYFAVGKTRIRILASIGFSICGEKNDWNAEETLKLADKALYEAKANGRNQVRFG